MSNQLTNNFILVKRSLIDNVLKPHEHLFQVIGHQRQTKSADDITYLRTVQAYFSGAQISKSARGNTGDFMHDLRFMIDLTVARASEIDVSVFDNPDSTAAQKASVLKYSLEAAAVADEDLDDLYGTILTILKSTENSNLGIDEKILTLSNLDITQFEKNDPVEEGGLVVVTGTLLLTCRIKEKVTSPDGILSDKIIESNIDINEDPVQQTGTKTDSGG